MSDNETRERRVFEDYFEVVDALMNRAPSVEHIVNTIADAIVCEAVPEYGNIEAALARLTERKPGAGWVYVGLDDANGLVRCGFFAAEHPRFEALRPALERFRNRGWANGGDLDEASILHAVRFDAVLAHDEPDEIACRYEGYSDDVDEVLQDEIEAWTKAVPLQTGMPEEVLGYSIVRRMM
jgi:hypothetical protein